MGLDANGIFGIVSAVLAVLGAIASGIFSTRANRQAHELDRRRRIESQQEAAERVLALYRDPMLDAAQTLQARLYNILNNDYFGRYLHCGDPDEEGYARDYTLFALGEYLCWAEIVRRELRFLDVGAVDRNRGLLERLDRIQFDMQRDRVKSPLRVLRGRQRAIAELMMVPTGAAEGPRTECMGYAAFSRKLHSDEEFAGWFGPLNRDIDAIAANDREGNGRLVELQRDLLGMIDYLDPDAVRITIHRSHDSTDDAVRLAEVPTQKSRRWRRAASR
jgi:hypothetical protein